MTKFEKCLLLLSAVFLLSFGIVSLGGNQTLPLRRQSAETRLSPATDDWTAYFNRATEEELCSLPGVGPVIAGRIVARREECGPYTSPEELLLVDGIGDRTLEKIYEYLEGN